MPHGACFRCIAGIQSQMRDIERSTEDNEEDKVSTIPGVLKVEVKLFPISQRAALDQLEGMLATIRSQPRPV